MKSNKKYRHVSIKFKNDEFEQFEKAFATTGHRSFSEYARNLTLGKPVTVFYRNRSLDDLIDACVELKKSLEEILLLKEEFSHQDKERLFQQIILIKDLLIQINDHVCLYKNIGKPQ